MSVRACVPTCVCARACVRACVCVCAGVVCREELRQYHDYKKYIKKSHFNVSLYIFVDSVKRGVLSLVHEVGRHRNERCYYH